MEEYRPIKDYPNYEVSNHGNVRNIKSRNIFTPVINRYGYKCFVLRKDGTQKTFKIHRIVAETFLENPNNESFVDHLDGNKQNNNANNLRYVSRSQNAMNSKLYATNTSNVSGVHFRKDRNKWRAYIEINNKRQNLGSFVNKEDAIKARKDAQDKYFGEFQKFNSEYERLQFKYNQLIKII